MATTSSFTTTILVHEAPMAVFEAILRPREWWGKDIDGFTDRLHEKWTYRYKDMHVSTQETTELIPGRRVVWHVADAQMNFLEDKNEWTGTDLVFDIAKKGDQTKIAFTHAGLVPEHECFDVCSNAWSGLIGESLKNLIETGKGLPDTVE